MARDGVHAKWSGRCDACGAWNTLVEELSGGRPPGALAPARGKARAGLTFETLDAETVPPARILTGVEEFDRVCGGGVAPGSALLVSGDPGVGKSTLLMQVCASAAMLGARTAYISGEEAIYRKRQKG